jgi:hypothetical protein
MLFIPNNWLNYLMSQIFESWYLFVTNPPGMMMDVGAPGDRCCCCAQHVTPVSGMFFLYPFRCLNFFFLFFSFGLQLGVLVFHPRYYSVMYMFCLRFWSSLQVIRVNLRASKSNYFLSLVELWKDQRDWNFSHGAFFCQIDSDMNHGERRFFVFLSCP